MSSILEAIDSPEVLKNFKIDVLEKLADELREKIISVVSNTGGHLGPSLGTIELTIALHYVLNCPEDILIWDVGHQAYSHKLLTGRKDKFYTLRKFNGISAFPRRSESKYDAFTVGHSSTSIAAALGFAKARDLQGKKNKVVAVIGDGALTGGLAFEALNNGLNLNTKVTVILNDNDMSIAPNVGAISAYLNKILVNPKYNLIKNELEKWLDHIPAYGHQATKLSKKLQKSLKNLVIPKIFFEEFGFRYFGVIDGHNIRELIDILENVFTYEGPKLIHVRTTKGKGYKPAEKAPTTFHGLGPFDKKTGEQEPKHKLTYSEVFGRTLTKAAEKDRNIVAITAAMSDGTGLTYFKERFPDRLFDVGIAEQFSVTFSAGLCAQGLKPVDAIYSTFLQRGYDQIIHDVALQNLPVVFAIDRGGLVGGDGPTHHGAFDLSYLGHIPNLTIMSPADEKEFVSMINFAIKFNDGPIAFRYSRASTESTELPEDKVNIELGKGEIRREGKDVLIISIGSIISEAEHAAEELESENISLKIMNARFLKPIDENLILDSIKEIPKVITLEDNSIIGGLGSVVSQLIHRNKLQKVDLINIGIPDKFIPGGDINILRDKYSFNYKAVIKAAKELVDK